MKPITAEAMQTSHRWVEAEYRHGGGLSLQSVGSAVDESGRSRNQGVDGLPGDKDRVAGRFGELFDAVSAVLCCSPNPDGGHLNRD